MTERTIAQQALWDALPPTTVGGNVKHYEKLTELPDAICEALTPMAAYLPGLNYESIQVSAKFEKLCSMTPAQVVTAFRKSNFTVETRSGEGP